MRKAACFVMTAALVLGAGAAFGQQCQQINLTLKEESTDVNAADYEELAEWFGFDSFEVCWSQRAIGTIRGTWVLCWAEGLFEYPLFELGFGPELWGNPGVIHTRDGDIFVMSYALSVWDGDVFVAFGGVTQYLGGTGAYEGATGWSTDSPKKYPPSYWIESNGILCVPD